MSWFDDNGDIPFDGGDNIDQGGGWNPGDGAVNDPWATEPGYGGPADSGERDGMGGLTGGSLSGGGSGGFSLGDLAKLFGLTNKKGDFDSNGMMQLLSMLGIGAGGLMSHNATNKATEQVTQGYKDANKAVTDIITPQMGKYDPYTQAGASAVGNLQNIGYKPMAGNYQPITLGTLRGK
jgi:hypothetical protein